MTRQRTGGMTAIGILNIVFGSIGGLLCLLVIVGGGLLAAGGAAAEANLGTGPQPLGAAAGGAIVVGVGLVGAVAWGLLFVAGIGVLKLAGWGRRLSMVCGAAVALLALVGFFTPGGVNVMSAGMFAYGLTLVGLFLKPAWKAAFAAGTAPIDQVTSGEDLRAAA